MGAIDGGTIECVVPVLDMTVGLGDDWHQTPGKDYADKGSIVLRFWGDRGEGAGPEFLGYLSIRAGIRGEVEIQGRTFVLPANLRSLSRHHVAVKFDGSADLDPKKTQVTVYYDGILSPTPPLLVSVGFPVLSPRVECRVNHPVGDVAFFAPPRDTPADITARAQRGAHLFDPGPPASAQGDYVSPLFTLSGPLERGARPRFLSWEGFIPSGTGGSMTFSVAGYDAGGNFLGRSTPRTWQGNGSPTDRLDLDVSCRKFRIEVSISAVDSPANPWPRVGDPATGNDKPTLLDTPILNECVLRWGLPRPAWGPVSSR